MIDPNLLAAGSVLAAGSAVLAVALQHKRIKFWRKGFEGLSKSYDTMLGAYINNFAELKDFRLAEEKRQAQRIAASHKAAEIRRLKKEADAKTAPERRAKTVSELANTTLRPRDEVVADIRAARSGR